MVRVGFYQNGTNAAKVLVAGTKLAAKELDKAGRRVLGGLEELSCLHANVGTDVEENVPTAVRADEGIYSV